MATDPPFMPGGDPAEMLAAIAEASEDAIIGETLQGEIVSWNPGASRLFGYSSREVVRRSASILLPAGREGELSRNLERIKSGERVESHDTVRLASDGRTVDVRLTMSPIRDAEGRLIGSTAIMRDVSDRPGLEPT